MIRIFHLRRKCIGCNACVEVNKTNWRISRKDGKATLIGSTEKNGIYMATILDDEYNTYELSVKNCPIKIIRLEKKS